MALNARKSCADSFLKIKTYDNRARFSRNQQNIEKFCSVTSKLYPVNLSEKRRDIIGVHQREADSLDRGSTAASVLAGQKGDMNVYKLMVQPFCIFDKILPTQIIFTVRIVRI